MPPPSTPRNTVSYGTLPDIAETATVTADSLPSGYQYNNSGYYYTDNIVAADQSAQQQAAVSHASGSLWSYDPYSTSIRAEDPTTTLRKELEETKAAFAAKCAELDNVLAEFEYIKELLQDQKIL